MQITFTGRNIDVTSALKTYAEEKLEKVKNRNITKIHVSFHLENVEHIAEATAHLHGVDLHATAKSDDMYSAIDMMVDKLMGQITKHKEKQSDHHR